MKIILVNLAVEEVLALQQLNYQNKKLKVFSKQVPLPDDRLLFVEVGPI